jgi:hypothetical protein
MALYEAHHGAVGGDGSLDGGFGYASVRGTEHYS